MGYYTTLVPVVQAEKEADFPVVPDEGNLLLVNSFILHFSEITVLFRQKKHSKCRNSIAFLQESLYNEIRKIWH